MFLFDRLFSKTLRKACTTRIILHFTIRIIITLNSIWEKRWLQRARLMIWGWLDVFRLKCHLISEIYPSFEKYLNSRSTVTCVLNVCTLITYQSINTISIDEFLLKCLLHNLRGVEIQIIYFFLQLVAQELFFMRGAKT